MFSHSDDTRATAGFLNRAMVEFCDPLGRPRKILDFGCGSGLLVSELERYGHDVYGCDLFRSATFSPDGRLRKILDSPYRLPFDDNEFDVVTSTSVLEHAKNQDEYMSEIRRVLKTGGVAMHLFPSKWYLPTEPHMYVPLANFFWPRCPDWWFYLFALLGCRNEFQRSMTWREVAAANILYFKTGIIYVPISKYNQLSKRYFASHEWPTKFFLRYSHGGMASVARRFPLWPLWEFVAREFRMSFLVQRK
jgi:SAM-dependent methyltransferase